MEAIKGFRDKYAYLSNFYESPFYLAGSRYATGEHAFQCMKTNLAYKAKIQMTQTPAEAKKLGRYAPLRSDWESVKIDVMKVVVFEKFNQNSDLLGKLLGTGDAMLWEVNNWGDQFWGVDPTGCGRNNLGVILMDVRKQFTTLLMHDDYKGHVYGPEVEKNIF
jgi:ribA/ribD-fused uncharacterized protein